MSAYSYKGPHMVRADDLDDVLFAVGAWLAGKKGDAYELADPQGPARGELQRFGDHYSLSFDGLSPDQVARVMQVLRTGY